MTSEQSDTYNVERIKQRIGAILGEHMAMRFSVTGDGDCHIFISDRWADSPDFVLTIEAMDRAA